MSTPRILTQSGQTGYISVGKNVPFITGKVTGKSAGINNPFQTIERHDVGVSLKVMPVVMGNGQLVLTIDIGYSVSQAPGLWRIYDTDGTFVRLEEAPLESPLIDPLDIALLAAGVFRIFLAGRALLQSGVITAVTVKGTVHQHRPRGFLWYPPCGHGR
ncbi:hypothetical protein [Kosakonia oryziphila]|uniref:hypothetical protein n=1 Tax=Kosakonia oryziphila TaxID=1005667 RepID=UPI0024465E4F|nr:hypothetical protein [Kosakonia oryziphila]